MAQVNSPIDPILAAPRAVDPEVAPHLDALWGGDSKRGAEIFKRTELSCARCHTTWPGESELIGPSLTGLGKRSSRLATLTSIVAPRASDG